MVVLEVALLVVVYSLLIISLFLQIVCYQKRLEFLETIAFTVSLILLIVSITFASIFYNPGETGPMNLLMLIAMILVGLTTTLNTLKEREHNVPEVWKKYIIGVGAALLIFVIGCYFSQTLFYAVYLVPGYLGISVILSMVLIWFSKPQKNLIHRERIDRILATAFLIVVPLSLLAEFYLRRENLQFGLGFMLSFVFMLLAGSKIWDDLERLALFKTTIEAKEQHFKNYSLTKREQEVAQFLAKGKTYKQISEELHISMPTVKTHASNIYRKCGVKNKSELTLLLIS